jgi:hypothetical protein
MVATMGVLYIDEPKMVIELPVFVSSFPYLSSRLHLRFLSSSSADLQHKRGKLSICRVAAARNSGRGGIEDA